MAACAKMADQRETEAAIVACFKWTGTDRARACASDLTTLAASLLNLPPTPYTGDKRQPMAFQEQPAITVHSMMIFFLVLEHFLMHAGLKGKCVSCRKMSFTPSMFLRTLRHFHKVI